METQIEHLIPVARSAANYLSENRVKAVFVPGPGAQTAAYMIKQAWKNNPELAQKEMPHFFALGRPKQKVANVLQDELKEWIEGRMGRHKGKYQKGMVMIMDDCYHSGNVMGKMSRALESMGFMNIKKGVFTSQPKKVPHLDFVGLEGAMCPSFKEFRRQAHKQWNNTPAQKVSAFRNFRRSIRNLFRRKR